MLLPSYFLFLVYCLIIHFQLLGSFVFLRGTFSPQLLLFSNTVLGIFHLLYPFCGWIAEVCVSKYKAIQCSLILLTLASAVFIVISLGALLVHDQNSASLLGCALALAIVAILLYTAGLSIYESNAIQFGMDQMMEAPSHQLSSFIHWYFWCSNVATLANNWILTGGTLTISNSLKIHDHHSITPEIKIRMFTLLIVVAGIQMFITFLGFLLTLFTKQLFCFHQMSRNSLKIIYKVLLYSCKHKYPERRSAFTYWEYEIPSCIDLGKDKYGGPFTYEEVEDVKTFFRLILIILSLFGFHLMGDGYSLSNYIICNIGCPSNEQLLLITGNPQHIQLLVVLIGVPLLEIFKKYFPRIMPTMLTRIWIGLFTSLFVQAAVTAYSLLPVATQTQPLCSDFHHFFKMSLIEKCGKNNILIEANLSSLSYLNSQLTDDSQTMVAVYLSIVPHVLHGISYLLVFMTTLEFICAQSPNSMKGLLIGIWYSTLSINYIIISNIDIHPTLLQQNPWSIYNGLKGFGAFLSIALFSLVCKHYRYRERNEIVNEQAIIEEQYERELLLNESQQLSISNELT